jgi:hypothetical protein
MHAAKKYHVRMKALVRKTRLRIERELGAAVNGMSLLNGQTTKQDFIALAEGVGRWGCLQNRH